MSKKRQNTRKNELQRGAVNELVGHGIEQGAHFFVVRHKPHLRGRIFVRCHEENAQRQRVLIALRSWRKDRNFDGAFVAVDALYHSGVRQELRLNLRNRRQEGLHFEQNCRRRSNRFTLGTALL